MRHAVTISLESEDPAAFVQARILCAVSSEFPGAQVRGVDLERLEASAGFLRDERDAYRDALLKAERRALA